MKLDFSHIRGDIFGGITAGVVALPLALALGVASGAGAIAGMYGAIIVGFFAALFGGTQTQITGPTGPMVVVFAGLFASLSGNVELVFTAVVLAGVLQILFGIFGLGQYIKLVPYPVVSGFMSGIGAIIVILQVGRLLGHVPPAGTVPALQFIPSALSDPNWSAVVVGGVSLALCYLWPAKLGKYLPAPLAALLIATGLGLMLPNVPLLGDIPSGLPSFHMPAFTQEALLLVTEAAFILAVLGSIDSLLTSLVADNMTRTRHESNRELVGQGIGNLVAGLFGGVASAGATMRTVINIRAGGRTRISGMIHSLLLLAVVLGLGPLAAKIPHAALAGILVKVGFDIVDWGYLRKAHRGPRWDLILMLLVLSTTVFVDLITAVAIGVVLAALAFVRQMAQEQIKSIAEHPPRVDDPEERALLESAEGGVFMFDFGGPLSFGAAADVGHHVNERTKEGVKAIVLDFSRVPFMDVSAARAVETIACDAERADRKVFTTGINENVRRVLSGLNADCCISPDNYFEKRVDALRKAVDSVADK
ncbi:MAG: SulP family inorganic anion transporter [Xanthomonadales bacterium]|jgi:SulP family sulfate permease|nr:SulP family inorganic anion transporter [Xanthomonadales bacterium]